MTRIVIVVIVILAAAGLAYYFGDFSASNQSPVSEQTAPAPTVPSVTPAPTPPTNPATAPAADVSPVPPNTPSSAALPNTTSPATPPPPPIQAPTTVRNVQFDIALTGIVGSGFTRTITAQLTNTGTDDAHNTRAKVELFSDGIRRKLSGNDYLTVEIGTLKGHTTITEQVTLELGMIDGLKVMQSGAQFVLTLSSDEHTQSFEYEYRP